MDNTQKLKEVKNKILNLTSSPLYSYRKKMNYYPVIGQGDHHAKIVFIGEAPGKNEALTGQPFCGAAGKILDHLLASINLDRKKVYITNIVKDRPPENRDPTNKEIDLYAPYLIEQIEIIKPRVIATLGRFSTFFILNHFQIKTTQSISSIKGKIIPTVTSYGNINIIPLFHPAVALYSSQKLPELANDFQTLLKASQNL